MPEITSPRFSTVAWLERRSRRQVVVAAVVVAVYLALRSARTGARSLLDRWWYDTVTETPIWSTMMWAKVQLAAAAVVVTLAVLGGSLALALAQRPVEGQEPPRLLVRYRQRMGPAHAWLLIGIVTVITARIAVAAAGEWQRWLLFRHGPAIGDEVPELGRDLGYYLFDLPFLDLASTWLRGVLLTAIAVSLAAYLVTGAIRLPFNGARSRPAALAHVGLLVAAFAAVQALDYVFVRQARLALSSAGSFVGAGFEEVRFGVPITWILAVVAVVAGALVVDAVRRDRWRLALAGVATWAALHLVLVVVLPVLVRQYVVAPAEGTRELPYLAHNLEATRRAFGLDDVDETAVQLRDGIATPMTATDAADLGRVPLFETTQLPAALQDLEGRTATRIVDVDLDRYTVDGAVVPVLLGARSPSRDDLPADGWVQTHLVYTHGDGVVAVPADSTDADGRPDVGGLGDEVTTTRPELYFGEGLEGWYSIVATRREEQGGTAFAADTGIPLDSVWRRSVLALSAGEYEPLISAELTGASRLLYRRGVQERLSALAPFLTFDDDPYPVVSADGVTWVVDGYTTATTYPYAERTTLQGRPVNYVHASVKATIDAYDGTVHLYRTEIGGQDDPVLDAWTEIFPGLVEPIAAMPPELRDHLRYPAGLLDVQIGLLGRYHVDDVETLFNGTARWSASAAPIPGVGRPSAGSSPAVTAIRPAGEAVAGGHFAATVPYSPGTAPGASSARNVLAALAVADHDEPERLHLLAVDGGRGVVVSSPAVAQSAIDADPDLAAAFESLDANGSTVEFGPMTPLVVDEGVVWVRSVIVRGTGATTVPRVYGVVAVSNGLVALGDDVAGALAALE